MKKVILFGTFDIIHPGHVNLFWQAQKLGDYIIAVVARDETVLKLKKRNPQNNVRKRVSAIKKSGLADKVVLGSLDDKYAAIKKFKPDVIALGYDQKYLADDLKERLEELGLKTKIVRMKAFKPGIYKTSKLLSSLSQGED